MRTVTYPALPLKTKPGMCIESDCGYGEFGVRQSRCTIMEDGTERHVPSARVAPEGIYEPAQHGAAPFNTSSQEQTQNSDRQTVRL